VFNQAIKKMASQEFSSWLLSKTLHKLDRFVLTITRGKTTATGLLAGVPVVWLISKGAKSGQERRTPLLGIFEEQQVILIASSFGSQNHPAWYYNVKAHPDVALYYNGVEKEYRARIASGEERKRFWDQAISQYKGFAAYQRRAGDRQIPVIILEPKEDD
jgi:deazaflavin-dependent oxidoreductase (nitroreductase family)